MVCNGESVRRLLRKELDGKNSKPAGLLPLLDKDFVVFPGSTR